jgi:hypothetical protein
MAKMSHHIWPNANYKERQMRWSLQARHPAPDLSFSFNKADEILSAIFKNKKKM